MLCEFASISLICFSIDMRPVPSRNPTASLRQSCVIETMLASSGCEACIEMGIALIASRRPAFESRRAPYHRSSHHYLAAITCSTTSARLSERRGYAVTLLSANVPQLLHAASTQRFGLQSTRLTSCRPELMTSSALLREL